VQVTGYVLIVGNAIESLGLNNLRIIRGESLFLSEGEANSLTEYSLYVALNYEGRLNNGGGLLELQLKSLRGEQNKKPSYRYRIADRTASRSQQTIYSNQRLLLNSIASCFRDVVL